MLWLVCSCPIKILQRCLYCPVQLWIILVFVRDLVIVIRLRVVVIIFGDIDVESLVQGALLDWLVSLSPSKSTNMDLMVLVSSEWHVVVLSLTHEIHLITLVCVGVLVAILTLEIELVAVPLIISLVPHVVVITLWVLIKENAVIVRVLVVNLLVLVTLLLLVEDIVSLTLSLQLKDCQPINIEELTDLNKHLLLQFDFATL